MIVPYGPGFDPVGSARAEAMKAARPKTVEYCMLRDFNWIQVKGLEVSCEVKSRKIDV
jgi:hypothetical protein